MGIKRDVVREVNACRRQILARGWKHDIPAIGRCVSQRLGPYAAQPHVRELLDTLARGSLASGRLLDLTFSSDPTFILGFLDVPYNPSAFLEAAALAPVPIPTRVLALAPEGHAMPVRVVDCTDGFRDPLSVAVFGENYVGADLREHHKAYYFIDKFVERFEAHTRPEIAARWSPGSFPSLMEADSAQLMQASAIWVHLHEYYHRTGALPLPKYLDAKSTRNGAGAEELRVDILSVLALLGLGDRDPGLEVALQYILAERLIRYPLQAAPHDNYDARSSVAFLQYLVRHDVVARRDGLLCFVGGPLRLKLALASLSTKIAALEFRLSAAAEADRRTALSRFLPALAQNNNTWARSVVPVAI